MASPQDTAQSIMAESQALVERVQSELADSQDELRRLGIDPAQLEARMTDADRKRAQQEVEADMNAVEQEVREELARRAFASPLPSSSSPRRRRTMV